MYQLMKNFLWVLFDGSLPRDAKGKFFAIYFFDMTYGYIELHIYICIKEVFSDKSCFKNFAHPLSEEENI